MKHKKQHLFGIFLNALALVRCVHSVSSKIHFLNTQHYSIANNERLLVYGFKVGIKRITLRGMKRRVRKMTFIVSIFLGHLSLWKDKVTYHYFGNKQNFVSLFSWELLCRSIFKIFYA